MAKKIGFIGCGNMGSAILQGILSADFAQPQDIIVFTIPPKDLANVEATFGVECVNSNKQVVQQADIIILAVKPNILATVAEEIKNDLTDKKVLVSIAAGKSLDYLQDIFGDTTPIIRVMPNTPALVGEGMSGIAVGKNVSDEAKDDVLALFRCCGQADILPESLFDAVVAASGSSPAFVYIFIEAMADAAVKQGMPREMAYRFCAQAVYGSAKMVLESGKHPAQLKDMVCSPAGTTIDGVIELEKSGFRAAIEKAMEKCADKSKDMRNN